MIEILNDMNWEKRTSKKEEREELGDKREMERHRKGSIYNICCNRNHIAILGTEHINLSKLKE